MFKRTFLQLSAAALASSLITPALALDPEDPYVLLCITDPTESMIGFHQDADLRVEAKFAGTIRKGWYGASCSLYGKQLAKDGETVVSDMPAAPNYIVQTVDLGPPKPFSQKPTVRFSQPFEIFENRVDGFFKVRFDAGIVTSTVNDYKPNGPADPEDHDYFASVRWEFIVVKESEAKKHREGIRVHGTLYSITP